MFMMRLSGCRNIHVGFESANHNILKNIKKGISAKTMEQFAYDAQRAGLQIHADFALGYVGETEQSIRETIEFAKKINPHTAQFQLFRPLQGTPMGDLLRKKGWLNQDGYPDYPDLSNSQLRNWAKRAYREFYFRTAYVKKALSDPNEYIFTRLDQVMKAVPNFIWKRWK
jgi:radical SAM superfamily enzyme YgiQ (UPF0313 family)